MEEGLALVVERKGKKRKRKKMREDRVRPFCQDPLDGLGRDLMLRVLNNLDARSLALCLVVSRTWNRVASSDLLWTSKLVFPKHDIEHVKDDFLELFPDMIVYDPAEDLFEDRDSEDD